MTATVTGPAVARLSHQPLPEARLSFGGVLKSEWIKLTTVRSTVWAYAIIVLIQLGMGAVIVLSQPAEYLAQSTPADVAIMSASLGVMLNQLVISVLGVLVITGEYGTGQIRSSLTAVPRRLPVLWAKAIVFAVASFVVGLVAVLAAFALNAVLLQSRGVSVTLFDAEVWPHLVGAAGYLALVGLIAFFLGALIRHTAGGIAAAMGLLLVVPSVLGFISAEWVTVLGQWLPMSVGQNLFFPADVFQPWQAILVMLGWIAVVAVPAAILLKRRDA
ncbi:ABC transporter permease [Herbiconiux sp.]|jgi:ABC-2 type transport system permease protein|uniref:ABC transporter permease n=1 Tax=Herbiconiux sp. TaxID=1871186 RepID=UPI0025BDA725|nr:ABC transporter permease [Herbiconiux sp.]